ncbi:MAG TPA: hypothetical protein VJ978_10025 [Nitriliruptoraceae bacterium]|nr:hypothetical protein [Nitriliruptoraceae bacterium]
MSAVIDIRSHRSRQGRPAPDVRPSTDELVAELATAVGSDHNVGDEGARQRNGATRLNFVDVPVVGTPDGPRRLISIQPDHRGGANDLFAVGEGDARRRPVLIAAVSIVLAMVLAVFAGLAGATATADADLEIAGSTTLQSGESLWEVADEITPAGQDIRPNLQAIMAVNEFESAALPAGTLVLLPVVD